MSSEPIYEEKQYLGFNRLSMIRRLLLTLFCFGIFWWKKMHLQNGDLFFWLGIAIIILSIVLLFVVHIRIRVYRDRISLEGLWTGKPVVLRIHDIRRIARTRYSRYHLNNPVFNLKFKGSILFYTDGEEAIEVTDEKGQPFRIGSHRPSELEHILRGLTANS